GDCPWKPWC
uniref:Contryphan-Vn n=1 Tax=Conus ventricosus TaxID=117992 RepID=COW_CONVE|nr:RecName: Full=Contryphan-Vn [Conus ventricosus]